MCGRSDFSHGMFLSPSSVRSERCQSMSTSQFGKSNETSRRTKAPRARETARRGREVEQVGVDHHSAQVLRRRAPRDRVPRRLDVRRVHRRARKRDPRERLEAPRPEREVADERAAVLGRVHVAQLGHAP